MKTDELDENTPVRAAIADTWRWKQDAAAWLASIAFSGGEAAAKNRGAAAAVSGLLDDFATVARARAALLLDDVGPTRLAREESELPTSFRARLLEAIRAHPRPLTNVDLDLDLRVWTRTTDSADRPVLAWLAYRGTELTVQFLPDESRAAVAFAISNTLFSALTFPDEDPNPLHALNQPLLEAALRNLRARASEPLEHTGELRGIVETGFSSDPDDY